MFESFLNPGYLMAGAALVSLPIIIHLINRMRFKRIRWAAMEFLLKSQKKNRRRLIIEQLILLALRCLLVLLAVLLVCRYMGLNLDFVNPRNTTHVVLLDDTLSQTDHWRDEGEEKDAFKFGKDLIVKEIAKNAVQARTAQQFLLMPQSDPNRRLFDQRLNDQTIQDLQKTLDDTECTFLHTDMGDAVKAAKEVFDKVPQDRRILHVVSDFRQRDWSEADAAELSRALDSLTRSGVTVNLIDTAHPFRNELQKTPLHHDNLAIIDLKPETRVVARDLPVQFTVTVANYGASERKNVRVAIKVNGGERLEGDVNVNVPPAGTKEEKFQIAFNQLGFNQVTANLENEESGLQADNVRYAVIDVRRQVPVLLVDGDVANGLKPGGDSYHIQTLLTAAKGYQTTPRGVNELEQPNLDQYASIYLLNVRDLSDKALKNLENYVKDGGSVAFFLGDKVRSDYYTDRLYAKGKGIFPAPLRDRPQPPLSDDEIQPEFNGQLKLFVLDEKHPVFAEVWSPPYRPFFYFLPIRRYYPVLRRDWKPIPGEVDELAVLPNERSMRDYAGEAAEIADLLTRPRTDEKYAKYAPGLKRHQQAIRDLLLGDKPLYELANALEAMLKDKGEAENPDKPNLVEFWNKSEYQSLRGTIEAFRKRVQLGDPLVISKVYGKGKVVAFMTTAGKAWNDWAGGSPASPTYPAVMVELQKFLTSGGGDTNRTVGESLLIDVDSARFEPRLRCFYQPETKENDPAKPADPQAKNPGLVDKGEVIGQEGGGRVKFTFTGARKPGLYRFDVALRNLKGTPDAEGKVDSRAFVFNVDPAEGDLKRAAKDDLQKVAAAGVQLRNPGTNWAAELANKQSDLSETPWFYLVFLLILVVEQALAVHLSFHLRGSEASLPGTTPRPQATAA
jgi:hypothetical protein